MKLSDLLRPIKWAINKTFDEKSNDKLGAMEGIFTLQVFDKSDNLVESYEDKNLIVNGARAGVARLIGGDVSNRSITKIAFGVNGNAPAVGNTAITSAFSKSVGSVTYEGTGTVVFNWTLEYNENNGMNIQEFGLLMNNNNLFSRKTRQTITKTSEIRLVGVWKIIV